MTDNTPALDMDSLPDALGFLGRGFSFLGRGKQRLRISLLRASIGSFSDGQQAKAICVMGGLKHGPVDRLRYDTMQRLISH